MNFKRTRLLLGSLLLGGTLFPQCTTILPFDDNPYTASVERYSSAPRAIRQDCENWCWAAVTQSLLESYKFHIDQASLASLLFGANVCEGATCEDMVFNMNHLRLSLDSPLEAIAYDTRTAAAAIAEQLGGCHPLIVGLSNPGVDYGHAYIIVSMTYLIEEGQYLPKQVVLLNPDPYIKVQRQRMSWREFNSRVYCIIGFAEH